MGPGDIVDYQPRPSADKPKINMTVIRFLDGSVVRNCFALILDRSSFGLGKPRDVWRLGLRRCARMYLKDYATEKLRMVETDIIMAEHTVGPE